MSRIRIIMLSMLAVFAVSAIASAPASAAHFCVVKGEKCEKFTGTKEVTDKNVSGKTFVLKSTLAGIEIVITCKALTSTGTITEPGATDTDSQSFTECTVTKPAENGCLVNSPGKAAGTIEVSKTVTKLVEAYENNKKEKIKALADEFKPENQTFVEIVISNCSTTALNGTFPVKGVDFGNCTGSHGTILMFSASSSDLTFDGNVASLTGEAETVVKGTTEKVGCEKS